MHEIVLKVENLSYTDAKGLLFDNLSFQVKRGSIFAVKIPKRRGNSAMTMFLSGLRKPTSGKISIMFRDWNELSVREDQEMRAQVGYIFSEGVLIHNRNIYDNLALHLRYMQTMTEDEIETRVYKYAEALGIKEILEKMPIDVDPVERKCAHICSVLLREPQVIIADDPFSQLGPVIAPSLLALLRQLNSEKETTIIIVTSMLLDLESLIDSACFIKDGKIDKITSFEDIIDSFDV